MRLAYSISSISFSCFVFLTLTCTLFGARASPLPSSSFSTLPRPWLQPSNGFPASQNLEWAADTRLLTKKSLPLTLDAESGWTMTFAPYGSFLPLQSVFMILESFYLGAIGRAIGAEVGNFPAQKVVSIALGSIGKPFRDHFVHQILPQSEHRMPFNLAAMAGRTVMTGRICALLFASVDLLHFPMSKSNGMTQKS